MKLNCFLASCLAMAGCVPGVGQADLNTSEASGVTGVKVQRPVDNPDIDAALTKQPRQASLLNGKLIVPQHITQGEAVTVELEVSNPQSYAVPLFYRSGKKGDLFIFDQQGRKVWTWSAQMMFTQALRETQLAPGNSIGIKFVIPASVIEQLWGQDYRLQAVFAGKARESSQDQKLMDKVTHSLPLID